MPRPILYALRGPVEPGTVVGSWTVLAEAPKRYDHARFLLCRCVCGKEREVIIGMMRTGMSSSCGCRKKNLKHGLSGTKENVAWRMMKQRCYNPKNKAFKNYGGRGILVCERWRNSFADFIADVGRRPSPEMTIDRIDNNGNYEPGNVRWATRKEQNNNTRWTKEARVQHGHRNAMKRWHPESVESSDR